MSQQTQTIQPAKERTLREEPFTQVQLEEVWRKFGNEIPDRHKMLFLFSSKKPKQIAKSSIELEVNDPLLVKDIEDIKPQLMAYLTQQLQNDKISLLITLVPLTAEHKAISNVDKIRLLKKKRPEFENMIQQLVLDPE